MSSITAVIRFHLDYRAVPKGESHNCCYYLISKDNYIRYWINNFHDVLRDLEEGISVGKSLSYSGYGTFP